MKEGRKIWFEPNRDVTMNWNKKQGLGLQILCRETFLATHQRLYPVFFASWISIRIHPPLYPKFTAQKHSSKNNAKHTHLQPIIDSRIFSLLKKPPTNGENRQLLSAPASFFKFFPTESTLDNKNSCFNHRSFDHMGIGVGKDHHFGRKKNMADNFPKRIHVWYIHSIYLHLK